MLPKVHIPSWAPLVAKQEVSHQPTLILSTLSANISDVFLCGCQSISIPEAEVVKD
jgi:hypothetical protein